MCITKEHILNKMERFVERFHREKCPETRWRSALVGVASARDPLFNELKRAVSPSHLTPFDLLPEACSVVTFFLPFEQTVNRSNREEPAASRQWAQAYIETNILLSGIGVHLKHYLETAGLTAVTIPPTHNYDPDRLVSDWSHRHAAFIAGLGTFGLNNMLITDSGCCGRIGSVVTSARLVPDQGKAHESCLYRHNGSCGKCVERCANEALFTDRFDRYRCRKMCLENEKRYRTLGKADDSVQTGSAYGETAGSAFSADVCGKCLVGIPCSRGNPVLELLRKDTGNAGSQEEQQ